MEQFLESLIPWGTSVILWVQSLSSEGLNAIFKGFTFLGYEQFYLFVLPLIYWCVDRRVGAGLGYLSLASAWINSLFKYIFVLPRPTHPQLDVPLPETSPSFPSGHAQNAVVNWGYLAHRFRRRIIWIVAVIVILGIGLSRIVLGVHFPQDVIGGWLIGLGVLALGVWAEPQVSKWISGQHVSIQLAVAAGIPLILIFLHPADVEGLYPAERSVVPMSTLVGLGIGLVMERRLVRFRVGGNWAQRVLAFLVGFGNRGSGLCRPQVVIPDEIPYLLDTCPALCSICLAGLGRSFPMPVVVRSDAIGWEGRSGLAFGPLPGS